MRKFFAVIALCALASLATACGHFDSPTESDNGVVTTPVTNPGTTSSGWSLKINTITMDGLPLGETFLYMGGNFEATGQITWPEGTPSTQLAQLDVKVKFLYDENSFVQAPFVDGDENRSAIFTAVITGNQVRITNKGHCPCRCPEAYTKCSSDVYKCPTSGTGIRFELTLAGASIPGANTVVVASVATKFARKPSGKSNQP